MKSNTSNTPSARATTIQEKESAINDAFLDRESRLIEAESILALIREIVAPPEDYAPSKPFNREWLGIDARYGLLSLVDQIKDILDEYHDSMCKCYEREQEGGQ